MIKIPAIFEKANDLVDRSCKITFATRELKGEEFLFLREHRGIDGWLLFSSSGVSDKDIPAGKPEVGEKTKSQRMRAVLYRLWEQEMGPDGDLDFDTYYKTRMEMIISKLKDRLE